MFIAVVIATAIANTAAAVADFVRAGWILDNMARYGLAARWVLPLGVLKLAGAVGLVAGLAVPLIGVAAAVGLVLYFVGAVVVVARARCWADLPYPVAFLLLAVATLALTP